VLKYSRTPEVSVRVSEALGMWQNAFEIVEGYQRKYTVLKEYLREGIRGTPISKRPLLYMQYEKELVTAENSLLEISNQLKIAFDDELIVKRHKVGVMLKARRSKIARLRAEAANIPAPLHLLRRS
jgi:hypothetical protein